MLHVPGYRFKHFVASALGALVLSAFMFFDFISQLKEKSDRLLKHAELQVDMIRPHFLCVHEPFHNLWLSSPHWVQLVFYSIYLILRGKFSFCLTL